MKTLLPKLILASGIAAAALSGYAQEIPNSSFETWNNGPDTVPEGWISHGSKHTGFVPVRQVAPGYSGVFAVKLENKIANGDTSHGTIATPRPGGVEGLGPAFTVNDKHKTFTGFYKFTPDNGDSAQIMAGLFKTGYVHSGGFGNVLGFAGGTLGAASVFTPFVMPFMLDDSTATPDSAYITIAAYREIDLTTGIKYPIYGNSVLIIDALNYDTLLINGVAGPLDITRSFGLYPTVNRGQFEVNFETGASEYTSIRLYDLAGRLQADLFGDMLSAGAHRFNYDLNEIGGGTYLFLIASPSGYRAEKIVIQK